MGFRSDVSIIFYARGNSNDASHNAILKLWFDENYPVREAKGEWCALIRRKDNAIIVDYDDVKWYSDHAHPREVDAAIKKFSDTFNCDEPDCLFAWEMMRIGEEDSDIDSERSDFNDHLLYVSRSIRVDMVGID